MVKNLIIKWILNVYCVQSWLKELEETTETDWDK